MVSAFSADAVNYEPSPNQPAPHPLATAAAAFTPSLAMTAITSNSHLRWFSVLRSTQQVTVVLILFPFFFFFLFFSLQPQCRRDHHRHIFGVSTPHACQHVRKQANASASAVHLEYFFFYLFRFTNQLSPATPACPHASQRISNHASASVGKAAFLATSARVQTRPQSRQRVHTQATASAFAVLFFFLFVSFTNQVFNYINHVDTNASACKRTRS